MVNDVASSCATAQLHVELRAEDVRILERVVVAPEAGTFHPADPLACDGMAIDTAPRVAVGDKVGVILRLGEKHSVRSPFRGTLKGLLVLPGERVRHNQPLAWLSTEVQR